MSVTLQSSIAAWSTHKLMDPKWIGMNGAFATRSPSGANRAHEKSSRSLIFVLMAVCWRERPIASATLMKRFAKSVRRIGSGGLYLGCSDMVRRLWRVLRLVVGALDVQAEIPAILRRMR